MKHIKLSNLPSVIKHTGPAEPLIRNTSVVAKSASSASATPLRVLQVRDLLQVLLTESGNIETRLRQLGVEDVDIQSSCAAIARAIANLDRLTSSG